MAVAVGAPLIELTAVATALGDAAAVAERVAVAVCDSGAVADDAADDVAAELLPVAVAEK